MAFVIGPSTMEMMAMTVSDRETLTLVGKPER